MIGRVEKIDLPELSLFNLNAKIDTGAYTSSLHCHKVITEMIDGRLWVSFYVLDPKHNEYEKKPNKCPVFKIKRVKSSNGLTEERVVIKQSTRFFGKKRGIELSLTNREKMKHPILIGRKFLNKRYIVDVSKTFLYEPGN